MNSNQKRKVLLEGRKLSDGLSRFLLFFPLKFLLFMKNQFLFIVCIKVYRYILAPEKGICSKCPGFFLIFKMKNSSQKCSLHSSSSSSSPGLFYFSNDPACGLFSTSAFIGNKPRNTSFKNVWLICSWLCSTESKKITTELRNVFL